VRVLARLSLMIRVTGPYETRESASQLDIRSILSGKYGFFCISQLFYGPY
jgi:hypothetical protein